MNYGIGFIYEDEQGKQAVQAHTMSVGEYEDTLEELVKKGFKPRVAYCEGGDGSIVTVLIGVEQ